MHGLESLNVNARPRAFLLEYINIPTKAHVFILEQTGVLVFINLPLNWFLNIILRVVGGDGVDVIVVDELRASKKIGLYLMNCLMHSHHVMVLPMNV